LTFTFRPAKREQTPLLIGLIGPTWTGKTYSALRLGTGIVSVRGGNLVGIDTEAKRMEQYADEFKFTYLEFGAPFSSLRYAEALTAAAKEAQGGCVIVDSQSHEHEGAGGYLDLHEQEVKRLCATGGFKSEFAAAIPAWAKPSAQRRALINAILQLNCAFIFCFRAKEKIRPVKGGNPIELGWQAIAGEEFGYEMTARCLLKPGAKGVPDWSRDAESLGVPKRIKDHISIFQEGKQLDEQTGMALANWARGSTAPAQVIKSGSVSPVAATPAAGATTTDAPQGSTAEVTAAPSTEDVGQGVNAGASTPTDSELVADIESWVKKRKFDMAYDLCRGIKDEAFRDSTRARIDKAKSYVDAKQSATNP